MFQDLKYALRIWTARPWHTGFAILALAIGIGANTGVFSVVDALLLHSLPFQQPDRLALLHQFIPPHDNAKQSELLSLSPERNLFRSVITELSAKTKPAAMAAGRKPDSRGGCR